MRSTVRQFRRAPGRILASIFALALAVGAIGVLAIPSVSEGTLHEAGARDGLADIIVDTTPLSRAQLAQLNELDAVERVEAQSSVAVRMSDGFLTRVIGLQFDGQTMDRLAMTAGRLPSSSSEVVTAPAIGAIGDEVVANSTTFTIVGHGQTLWWSGNDVLFAELDAAQHLADQNGSNRLVITAVDDDESALRSVAADVRSIIETDGDTYTSFPAYLPNGSTPIDQDINQISGLIGLLGVFAGLVALVLLASTTTTLITERTREVAVMRALGGRSRQLRRRLRRIALSITVAALIVGLPLGIVISNFIARMVLEEFVGITPDFAVNWAVVALSAAGALVGARLVAARAARKVVKTPLAGALRDRDGDPFGRSWYQRLVARIPSGGLSARIAGRAAVRRPARTVAVVVQISAAVGAAFLIPSLVTSVNEFNGATTAPWSWESVTVARSAGLPFDQSVEDRRVGLETGVWISGEIDDWEVDVFGLAADTVMFDPMLSDGRWIDAGERSVVVSEGFASRNSIDVGDEIAVELPAGPSTYEVVGLADDARRAVYAERSVLAADLGQPSGVNTVWSMDESPNLSLGSPTRTTTATELAAESKAGRDAVVLIFGAIGVIVAGVAALAVMSSMTVALYERRHEFAALQALGSRRRRLRGLVIRELVPIASLGIAGGLVLGALGTRGIIGSFETSNAVDIGVVDATGSIPMIVAGTFVGLTGLAMLIVRVATRRSVAVTLRGAA